MRRKCDFHIQSCNTSLFKKSMMNAGVKLYNSVPNRIKELESFKDFKQKLKLVLLDHLFYSLNKFFF
jgi:hypothetical protein